MDNTDKKVMEPGAQDNPRPSSDEINEDSTW